MTANMITYSPSKLQEINECPAKYYYSYVAPSDIKVKRETSDMSTVGNLIHRALELATLRRLSINPDDRKPISKQEILADLDTAATEPQEEWKEQLKVTANVMATAREKLVPILKRIDVKHVIHVEKKFKIPYGTVTLDDGNVINYGIEGVIDRIDENEETITIVDYKSGWSMLTYGEASTHPQVLTYLAAGKRLWPDKKIKMLILYVLSNVRVGPFEYTEEVDEWYGMYLRDSVVISHKKFFPEKPGLPYCSYCQRNSECRSFKSSLSGSMSPMNRTLGDNLELFYEAKLVEKNIKSRMDAIKPFIKSACENSNSNKVYGRGFSASLSARHTIDYPSLRETTLNASKMMNDYPMPPITGDPIKDKLAVLERDHAILKSAYDMACEIGSVVNGRVKTYAEKLPESKQSLFWRAAILTQANSTYYVLDVDKMEMIMGGDSNSECNTGINIGDDKRPVKAIETPGLFGKKDQATGRIWTKEDEARFQKIKPEDLSFLENDEPPNPFLNMTNNPSGPQPNTPQPNTPTQPASGANPTRSKLPFTSTIISESIWVDPKCVACGGSGKNSRGGQCSPCITNGKKNG